MLRNYRTSYVRSVDVVWVESNDCPVSNTELFSDEGRGTKDDELPFWHDPYATRKGLGLLKMMGGQYYATIWRDETSQDGPDRLSGVGIKTWAWLIKKQYFRPSDDTIRKAKFSFISSW